METEHLGIGGQQRELHRAHTQTKAEIYEDLYDALSAISRTAKAISADVLGLNENFRMPRNLSYPSVLAAARGFYDDALPLHGEFVEYAMPEAFLMDLQ